MIKAVLFDLDGTLLDTLGDIQFHVNTMLSRFGYPEITREQTASFVGDGAEKLIERALPEGADFGECYAYFIEWFSQSNNEYTKLYEGELDYLQELKAQGVKLAVITNKPQSAMENCIKKFFPEGTFDYLAGDSGTFPCKPDPSLATFCALNLRVPLCECAFVGDGETDVLTAKNAGMKGVAVLWGYRSKEQLTGAGATVFARDFQELKNILKNF